MEVAHIGHHMGSVPTGEQVNSNVARAIDMLVITHHKVAHRSFHLIVLLHVGVDIQMGASANGQWRLGKSQSGEVGIGDISDNGSAQTLAVQQSFSIEGAFHQRILAVHRSTHTPIANIGISGDIVQTIVAILELLDLCFGGQTRLGRCEVGALPTEVDICGERTQSIIGQETLQSQFSGFQTCGIGRLSGVEVNGTFQFSTTLVSHETSLIALISISLQVSFQLDVLGDIHVALQVARHQLFHKREVVALGVNIDVGLQALHVIQILCIARHLCLEGGGQRHVQALEAHALHVSTSHSIHRQRFIGPTTAESSRHGTHQFHHVLLAQRSMYIGVQTTWIVDVERVEIHIQVGTNGGFWRLQVEIAHIETCGVEGQSSREAVDSYAALLGK